MRYPRWFPYPGSWLKALILCVSLIPLTIFFEVTQKSVSYVLGIKYVIDFLLGIATRSTHSYSTYVYRHWDYDNLGRIWLWLIITGVVVPIFAFSYVYQWLWSTPSTGPFRKWVEGIWSWLICLVAFIFSGLVLFIRHDGFPSDLAISGEDKILVPVVFLITAAYLYQFRALVKELWDAMGAFIKRIRAAIKHWFDTV